MWKLTGKISYKKGRFGLYLIVEEKLQVSNNKRKSSGESPDNWEYRWRKAKEEDMSALGVNTLAISYD